jgi:putative addiction module component (TIGR02574 family)
MKTELVEEMVKLPAPERLEMIGALWDSLNDGEVPLTKAQVAELDRRLDDMDKNPGDEMTWEEAKQRIVEARKK